MLNCPNINTKEWKDLVAAIGEREAFREYMKLGTGEIPSVTDIQKEILIDDIEDYSEEEVLGLYREDVKYKKINFRLRNNKKYKEVLEKFNIKSINEHFYYVLTDSQQRRIDNYLRLSRKSKDPEKAKIGTTFIGFELESQEKSTENYEKGTVTLKVIDGITYLFIEEHEEPFIEDVDGFKFYRYPVKDFYKIPVDIVGSREQKEYLIAEQKKQPYTPFIQKEINKYLLKTRGITAPRSANFFLLQYKNFIRDAFYKTNRTLLSYNDLSNLSESEVKNLLQQMGFLTSLDDIKEKYQNYVDSLNKDEIIKETLDLYQFHLPRKDKAALENQFITDNKIPVSFAEYVEDYRNSLEMDGYSDVEIEKLINNFLSNIYSGLTQDGQKEKIDELETILNYLPEEFLKLLTFQYIQSYDNASFTFASDKNADPDIFINSPIYKEIMKLEEFRGRLSVNLALKKMLIDGLITEEDINKINDKLRPDIIQFIKLKDRYGPVAAEEYRQRNIKKIKEIRAISIDVKQKFADYFKEAQDELDIEAAKQNAGLASIGMIVQKNISSFKSAFSSIEIGGDMDPLTTPFVYDPIVVMLHELGHALDMYLHINNKEGRDKIVNFINKLKATDEFKIYIYEGIYRRGYSISHTKEFTADLFAYLIAKATNKNLANSHLQTLDEFFETNSDLAEKLFDEVFGRKFINELYYDEQIQRSERPTPQQTSIVAYIKKLINDFIKQVNKIIGKDFYKPFTTNSEVEIVNIVERTPKYRTYKVDSQIVDRLINMVLDKENFKIENILNSQYTRYTWKQSSLMNDSPENNLIKNEQEQKAYKGEEIAMGLAGQISLNTGIPFVVVTPEEALTIDPNYAGQKSFYVNGVTYFLAGKMSMDNVLHEFAHPFVDAIYATNPELFNKLYSDLTSTEEGTALVRDVEAMGYTTDRNNPNFRKEVFVRAMTKEAMNNTNDVKNSTGFKDFINKFIFAIKQALRKVFGTKVKIDKLSTNTTLAELANMLKSDKFSIDTELVSEKDYVAYARDISEFQEALSKVENPEENINPLLIKFFRMLRNQISLVKSPKYAKAREVVAAEKGVSSLEKIAAFLKISPEIDEPQKRFYDEVTILEKNTFNFTHAVLKLNELMDAVNDHLDVIKSEPNHKLVLNDIYYYSIITRNWEKFINEATEQLVDNGLDLKSEFGRILSSMNEKAKQISRKSIEGYIPGLVEMYMDILAPTAKGIDDYYSSQIKKVQKDVVKGDAKAKKFLDKLEKKWDSQRITEARIRDYLLGNIADTNQVSPWLESYITNPDIITSGFALITKNAKAEVNFEALKNTNEFVNAIEPLLKAAGYTRYNFVKLMKQISFIDNDTTLNQETGELEQTPRKSFLHPFKNMDAFLKKSQYDYERAIESGDQDLADQIIADRRQHLKDYFHQPYVSEYYDREQVYDTLDKNLDLEDAVYGIMGVDKATATNDQKAEAANMYKRAAQKAYRDRHHILNQIKREDALSGDDLHREDAIENKKQLWRDYGRLTALRDKNGQPKFGEELLSTLIEKKYRAESRKFFDYVPIEGEYEQALALFEQGLVDQGYKPKLNPTDPDGQFEIKRAKWIKDNTIIKYKKEFYEERNKILTRLRNALSKIKSKEVRDSIDQTIEMEQLLDIVIGYRDENGQVIGDDINDRQSEKIKELQEKIIEKRNTYVGLTGLTPAQYEEYNRLFGKRYLGKETLTPTEQERLQELFAIKDAMGVDKALKLEIQKCYQDIIEIQAKEATDYYVEIVNEWMGRLAQPLVDNETANELLEPGAYNTLLGVNEEFDKWFEANHILKEKWIPNPNKKGDGETILVYERLFHWNKAVPRNEDYIEILPSRAYYERVVKPEFLTEKIVGVTVDNRDRWLPKTIAQGAKSDSPYINQAYYDLQRDNPAAFKVLEKIKEFYLRFQEDMVRDSRLYMQVPRFRNMALENVLQITDTTKKTAHAFWLGLRSRFVKTDDNYEEGLDFSPADLVNVDMFNEEMHKVPIRGLYNLKPEETSDNFLDSIIRYMHSGLEQRKLIELNYFAQALQDVLKNPKFGIIKAKSWIKWMYLKFKRRVPVRSKKMSQRAKNIINFHAREYLGENTVGVFSESQSFWKTKNTVSSMMSLGLFGLNIPSAIKGREATVIQQYIEATGGRYMNMANYLKGAMRAELMMLENSTQIYATKNKSLNVQIMQIFDPGQEFLSRTIERQFGRSLVSDMAGFTNILMAPRKYLQFAATVKTMAGMLYHEQVDQIERGKKRTISYINAFEVKNGTIQLKPGIDPDYSPEKVTHTVLPGETVDSIAEKYFITKEELLKRAGVKNESEIVEGMEIKVGNSRKFFEVRNRIHEVSELLEGSYSKIGRTELDRTVLGSATRYMKKYFAPMFMNWFGVTRPNAAIGGLTVGNYTGLMNVTQNILNYGGKGFMWSNAADLQGFYKSFAQLAMLIFHYSMLAHIFGYDPDDKKRFKRMKKREEEGMFSKGWRFNSAAAIHYATMLETETFNIWLVPSGITGGAIVQTIPGPLYLGKTIFKLPEQSAFTMAASNLMKIGGYTAMSLSGEEKAKYQKDEGPWWYQKEGADKVWNVIIGNFLGLTGDTRSPAKAMEKQEEARRRVGF